MHQAKQTNRPRLKDPAGNPLKVVYSITQTQKEEEKKNHVKEEVSRTRSSRSHRTHHGRSYHPDGPSGNYQGL